MIYYIIFSFVSFSSYLHLIKNSNKKGLISLSYLMTFIMLVFLAGLRKNTGFDYGNYKEIHEAVNSGIKFNEIHGEYAFLFLNKIFNNFEFFILFIAFLGVGLNFEFIRKYSEYPIMSLLIYFPHIFLLREMGQIRAGISIAICSLSLEFLTKNKKLKFILFTIIASLIHSIALLFLLLYPVLKANITKKKAIVFLLIGFILYILKIDNLFFIHNNYLPSSVQNYLSWDQYMFKIGFNLVVIKQFVITSLLIYNKDRYDNFKNFNVIFNSYFVSLLILLTFNNLGIIAGRTATLFSNVEIIIIPMMIKNSNHKKILFFIVLIYSLFTIYSNLNLRYSSSFIPYKSIINM